MNRAQLRYHRKRQRQTNWSLVWFLAFVICAFIASLSLYLHFKPVFSVAQLKDQAMAKSVGYFSKVLDHRKSSAKAKVALAGREEASANVIHFDFYNELPKAELATFKEPNAASTAETATRPLVVAKAAPEAPTVHEDLVNEPAAVNTATQNKEKAASSTLAEALASDLSALQEAPATTPTYILQLGLFHKQEAANLYREALKSAGLKVDLVKLRMGRELVYRLQQGPYHEGEQLKAAKKRLSERGIAVELVRTGAA